SIFMMPHLGVLSGIDRDAALEVFHRDCLVMLGTCIAPSGSLRWGKRSLQYRVSYDGGTEEGELAAGDMLRLPETAGSTCRVEVEPRRGLDVGAGRSTTLEAECPGGEVGLVFDARGRPLELPEDPEEEARHMREWARALSLYPEQTYDR
ncbi:MAG: methylaspartate mutase, partial [Planctomycetota bacterium]